MTNQQVIGVHSDHATAMISVRQAPLTKLTTYFGVPCIVTGILLFTSVNSVSLIQIIASFALLAFPWVSYRRWVKRNKPGLPVFALIAGLHWLYFAVAVFWGNRLIPVWYLTSDRTSDDAVTAVLFMALLGVVAFGLGLRIRLFQFSSWTIARRKSDEKGFWDYVRLLLISGVAFSYLPSAIYLFGESGRNWMLALQSTVPLFAAVLLLRKYFQGSATRLDQALILFYVLSRILTGLGSGWSGSIFYLGLAIGLVYLLERRRIPTIALILVLVAVVFLQTGKSEFRAQYWYSDNTNDALFDRINFWLEGSIQEWQEILSDPTGEKLIDQLRSSILRVSLLTHAANVYEQTPEIVPFQGGKLYEFAIIGFIPRFVWPDKPSGNDANQFYQVAYSVTPEGRLYSVSIAIGYLIEAYISFGWAGIVAIMFMIGIMIGTLNRVFFIHSTELIGPSIGIIAVLSLLRVETQMGLYVVSTIQSVIVTLLILLPTVALRRRR